MMPAATIGHIRVDNIIIDEYLPQIGPYGYTIYCVIKRFLNQKTGDCYPSYTTIAKKCGCDRGTVIRYVKKLTALKLLSPLLRFKDDGSHTSNQYNFQSAQNGVPSRMQRTTENPVPSKDIDPLLQTVQGGCAEPPPVVAENNHPSGRKPPEQFPLLNKKERTIAKVDLMPTEKQKTCPHPPELIVILPDNITICNHCYGLLNENLKLQEEEKSSIEIVAA